MSRTASITMNKKEQICLNIDNLFEIIVIKNDDSYYVDTRSKHKAINDKMQKDRKQFALSN